MQAPPLGKLISFNMDIVGGATSSLCEVMRESVTSTPAGHFVNMLFETETDARVRSLGEFLGREDSHVTEVKHGPGSEVEKKMIE